MRKAMKSIGLKKIFLTGVLFSISSLAQAPDSAIPRVTHSLQSEQANPKEITIGFTPVGDKELLKRGAFTLAKKLQSDLGIGVNIFVPKSYTSLSNAIKEKRVDFAFLTAASFVALESETKMQVLLKQSWATPFYYSVILVRKDSKIKKLDDLQGKTIAFVDKKSTSGYLYPQVMLKKRGWTDAKFKEVKFSGTHSVSVQMLQDKTADAIAVFSDDKDGKASAWEKFAKIPGAANQVRVLWASEPIPNDPFCVRQDFYDRYPKLVHTLMFSLIDDVEALKDNKDVVYSVGHGFLPATSRQYDPVREMVKELGPQLD
jgi:phosphonate transport system substrate-binding protein